VLNAIPRYGARIIPNTQQTIGALRKRGHLIDGPQLGEFERAFAVRVGASHAVSTSYGRMAFYYLLEALKLPPGSEVVVPALTFWVIPELAHVAGLTPVFADVDPVTFTLDPESVERVVTPRTSAIVPTHLYGLPCDMDAILRIARRHRLRVIEDCAHALGARWKGQPVGTIGDAGFFSFQLLKPLNTYGGGMAVTQDPAVADRVRAQVATEPFPGEAVVLRRLRRGRMQRIGIRPRTFTLTLFPLLWLGSYVKQRPDVYLWERIRPLGPPASYHERYTNVQAAIGLEALSHLDAWTATTIEHATSLTRARKARGSPHPSCHQTAPTCSISTPSMRAGATTWSDAV
jgi:perosamine synthetase